MKLHNYILLLFLKSISLIFLLVSSAFANEVKNSATVFMYHKFGVSKYPSTSVTIDQLNSHIEELTKEKYTIKSLDFIIDTIINDGDLPVNTIGISVDDADKSFLEVGWPLFKENNIPVTLFVTTGTISNNKKYINWDQIRKLKEEGVVIGAHSHTHAHMPDISIEEVRNEIDTLKSAYENAVAYRGRTTVGASEMSITEFAPYIVSFLKDDIPKSPRKGLGAIPQLKLVVEDLQAYYTEAVTHRDGIDDFEKIGSWFWEKTKAGQLILSLEAVSLESENRVLRQIVDMSLITPRFWSEGPLPGTSGSGW